MCGKRFCHTERWTFYARSTPCSRFVAPIWQPLALQDEIPMTTPEIRRAVVRAWLAALHPRSSAADLDQGASFYLRHHPRLCEGLVLASEGRFGDFKSEVEVSNRPLRCPKRPDIVTRRVAERRANPPRVEQAAAAPPPPSS